MEPGTPGEISRRTVLGAAAGAAAMLGIDGIFLASPASATAAPQFVLPTGTTTVGDNFQEHKDREPPSGRPGTDYWALRDDLVWAAAAGTVSAIKSTLSGGEGRMVTVTHIGGWKTYYLHLSAIHVNLHQSLQQGTVLGKVGGSANDSESGWPAHLHISLYSPDQNGYVDFEDYVVGPGSPLPTTLPQRSRSMTTRFAKIGTGSVDGDLGTVVALAGDAGYPCPANWQEYTRTVVNSASQLDRAAWEYKVHGGLVWIPAAQWDALKKAYTEGGPTVGVPQTVSLSAEDRALLLDIAAKLEAQPA